MGTVGIGERRFTRQIGGVAVVTVLRRADLNIGHDLAAASDHVAGLVGLVAELRGAATEELAEVDALYRGFRAARAKVAYAELRGKGDKAPPEWRVWAEVEADPAFYEWKAMRGKVEADLEFLALYADALGVKGRMIKARADIQRTKWQDEGRGPEPRGDPAFGHAMADRVDRSEEMRAALNRPPQFEGVKQGE